MERNGFLIVGQGIAGTALAWHLHRRGFPFLMVDDPSLPSSSRVAAGIFNPLTGRKLVKTWLADDLFPYTLSFYEEVSALLGTRLLHRADLFRPFRSAAEREGYLQLASGPDMHPYIAPVQLDKTADTHIHAPYNGLTVTRSGWVDIPAYLDLSRDFFEERGCFAADRYQAGDMQPDPDGIRWKGRLFSNVVLCQGVEAMRSPVFGWLPFNPVKGQVIDGTIPGYDTAEIVNQGVFILPLGNGRVRVGATYSWHDLDWEITADGRDYLLGKLSPLLKAPFLPAAQRAGIRPAVKDRRPLIGFHPELKNVAIFNGLGTKGVTLAPYFARQLVAFLEKKEDLQEEVNIKRHFSLYFQS